MNPDAYMPLYGDEFFQAVEGQSDLVITAYMRCIWYYWSHTHCEGLKDDQEFLRKLCRCDRGDWDETMAIIFDNKNFFTLGQDGLWHQKRAAMIWNDVKEAYEKKVKQTTAASNARWRKKK